MPYLIFDIELAGDAGYNEDPLSIMRQLRYPSADVVAGHPSLGTMIFSVNKVLHPLPVFLSVDEETAEPATKITYVKSPARKVVIS